MHVKALVSRDILLLNYTHQIASKLASNMTENQHLWKEEEEATTSKKRKTTFNRQQQEINH